MDKRTNRVQPIRLNQNYFPLDIHKSMFINDLTITIPAYYVTNWGDEINYHTKNNRSWKIDINYIGPRELENNKNKFPATLSLSFIKNRNKESSYRLKWDNKFAVQLAKDYPKSFVRSLEFHIGDNHYKERRYTEFDIGGFKEQLQVNIKWVKNKPVVTIKELFRIKDDSQGFPKVFSELSSYLIADYLLNTPEQALRNIQVSNWRNRSHLSKELKENIIYVLANRNKKQIYFGETGKSLSARYSELRDHHSFDEWNEFIKLELPYGTSSSTRKLIERVLIEVGCKLFNNNIDSSIELFKEIELKNLKR